MQETDRVSPDFPERLLTVPLCADRFSAGSAGAVRECGADGLMSPEYRGFKNLFACPPHVEMLEKVFGMLEEGKLSGSP
jgi:hypothetical protein